MSAAPTSQLKPKQAAQWRRAQKLLREHRLPEAVELFEKLAHRDRSTDAWVMAGAAARQMGNLVRAEQDYRRALAIRPDYSEVKCNLGQVLLQQKKLVQAEQCFKQTLTALPDFAPANRGLGSVYLAEKRLEAAEYHLQRSLDSQPNPETAALLAVAAMQQGKIDEAEALFIRVLRSGRDSFNTNLHLAYLYLSSGRAESALEHFRRAGDIRRDRADPKLGQARALAVQLRFDEAEAALAEAGRIDRHNLSETFARESAGTTPEDALPNPQTATALLSRQWLTDLGNCNWQDYELRLQAIKDQLTATRDSFDDIGLNVFDCLLLPIGPVLHREVAERRSKRLVDLVRPLPPRPDATADRLRIGYVSPDFRRHAVAQLYRDLFKAHDRERFEIHGYSLWPETDGSEHREIRQACDHFVYLDRISNRQAAARIREDGIHILVDLAGYTRYGRPEIFAARPAPLQLSYGGFPGTCAAPWLDYKFFSADYLEPGDEKHYSEQPILIPDTHHVVSRLPAPAKTRPSRKEFDLPEDGFLFCSFQSTKKLEPSVFSCWMRILAQVEGSYLWLLAPNPMARSNLRHYARQQGIAPERLVFTKQVTIEEHIRRQAVADLFLDTWIYSGLTTITMALWAGLPILTLPGDGYSSRQGRACLSCYGIGREAVATDPDDYEEKAVYLARNPGALRDLRDRITSQRNSTPLFQPEKTIKHVEQAYSRLWQRYLAGQPPAAFKVE